MENTPGWNDPPKSCQITNTVGSGAVKLNKRIAFPNSSSKDNSTIKTESAMSSMLCDAGAKPLTGAAPPPPPLATNLPIPGHKSGVEANTNKTVENEGGEDEEIKLEDVTIILEATLCKVEDSGVLDAKKASDIRKRIGIFKEKWTNNRLNGKVHQGMLKLARLLQDGQVEEAEKIQRNLNVEHPNLCTPWMIAIRQLILAQTEKLNKTNI